MKNTSEYVVQTLIDDEDMSAALASLYPAASKSATQPRHSSTKRTRPSKRRV